jgi:TolB-like protein
LVADVVGYSRLAGADEDRTLARLRGLRSDLIDPAIAAHHGRIVKRTGDGSIIEFRSVVDAVRCAIELQNGLIERNAGLPPDRCIEFRVGIHLGDVVEEVDGDLMGDGVNIAARLEGVCEPGGVCLSGAAYEQVRDRVKEAFVDLGEKALKNIARPVRVYAIKIGAESVARAQHASPQHKLAPPHLSIVVLPFANTGGDPEQYFADGVTESLTTDLSRMSGMVVIGRSTAITYKGKGVDLKQIGRDLNVRYVLEGSIQRGGDRMRVNVQLIDAGTGTHLWAERFDKPVADLFDMQDEIVARLAAQLQTELIVAEARRGERAVIPDATDLIFRAWATFSVWSPESLARAHDLFERALALDQTNIEAIFGKATVDFQAANSFQVDDRAARLASAEKTLTKVLALEPGFARAHMMLGLVQMTTNRPLLSIAALERALTLDRNLATTHAALGQAKSFIDRAEETEAHVQEALRLRVCPRTSCGIG